MRRYWDHYFSFTKAETIPEAFFRGLLLGCVIYHTILLIAKLVKL